MKELRKISKKYCLKEAMVCWLIFYMVFCFGIPVQTARATPSGGEFQVGGGAPGAEIIDGIQHSTVTVGQMESIIHWNSLDTTSSQSLSFSQTSGLNNAAVLNRVVSGDMTKFNGTLNGQNMRIFMINPAGIVFGQGAHINVSQLTASSLNITNDDFLNGAPYTFHQFNNAGFDPYPFAEGATVLSATGDVIFNANASNVIAAERLYLIGKYVRNKGGLVASDYVVMAAGDKVIISEPGSSVAVELDWTGVAPADYGQFKVENRAHHSGESTYGGIVGNVATKIEAEHIILAAGDLFSQAITSSENKIKTVEIDVKGEIQAGDLSTIDVYSGPGSDAVAGVSITSGSNVTIDDDITATAMGNGVDNAYATIDISSGGDLTIESDGSSGTELVAQASDGVNNSAEISLTAAGAFTIDAPDLVTVQAEAGAGKAAALLNQANVNIAGDGVLITATDDGKTDAPATVYAYAHDAVENQAGVDIQATEGDVEIIGAGKRDNAIVEAEAQGGSVSNAEITINAAGNVDIIAEKADAQVLAYAHDGEDNTANVDITAGGDVTVKSEGGSYDHEDGFTPYVASVEADAENALNSNNAGVDITAGGDVVVLSEDGGEARVEAYAGNALDSQNTATVNLTAEDGYVLVHAIGGYSHEDEFAPSEASVKAIAENAGGGAVPAVVDDGQDGIDGEDVSTNNATITIVAKDIVEETPVEVASIEGDGEEECFGDGDVGVIAVNGGKAEVEAIAKHGDENTAGVNVTADGDVEVIAKCEGQPSEAEIMALAKDADVSNTALVDITAGGNVEVLSENGGKAEIEAIAKDSPANQADVVINADGEVIVKAEGGDIDEWQEKVHDSWDVKIKKLSETWDVKVQQLDEAECWVWKFHKNSGTSGPTYKYITTYENVNPGNPSGYHYDSVQYNEATYDYAWLNDCPEHDPNPADYGKSGWELAGVWQDHKTHYDYAEIDNCLVQNPDLGPYGYAGWTIYDTKENYHWEDHSSFTASVASIAAIAENDLQSNTANVAITAGGDVKVMAFDGGVAEVIAATEFGELNTSGVTINSNGDVKVLAIDGTESTKEGFTESEASIKAKAENGSENTATVNIDAVGGDVLVLGVEGGEAAITALAKDALSPTTNTANVTIHATEVDITEMVETSPGVFEEVVVGTEGGDVKVIAKEGGEAEIEALAIGDQTTNNAGVLICADGDVKVKGEEGGEAEIEALAKGWEDSTNTATVGICAKGEEGVEVIADRGGEAGISSKAKDGYTNTASTVVVTKGGVLVKATRGGDAEILAQAKTGITNTAYTGIGAMEDVVVQTGEMMPDQVEGCDAVIRAEADTGMIQLSLPMPGEDPIITTNKAETVVFSHEGNVEVRAYNHGDSGIEAEAQGGHLNTAKVGVAAGADLSPSDVIVVPVPDGEPLFAMIYDGPYYSTGNVIVEAYGDSKAQILSLAHNASNIYEYPVLPGASVLTDVLVEPTIIPGENTAKTVICAPGEVRVTADKGSTARIKSEAGPLPWQEDEGSINKATTKVYASEVTVNADGPGNGIRAYAYGVENQGKENWCLTIDGEVAEIVTNDDGSSELIIQDYSKRTDCPTCPPCPCEKEEPAVLAPVAPLAQFQIPRVVGCPVLTQAAAAELGITSETLQVAIGNAMALNPNIQPCQACETLVNAASILRDGDGSRMAALASVVNEVAPPDVPPSPEQMTLIASTLASGANDNAQYAAAGQWLDALAQYVGVLNSEFGYSKAESVAFASKYASSEKITTNAGVAAYVEGRLAAMSQ